MKVRKGTITPFFLTGLCAILIGSMSAAVIHLDGVFTGVWDSANAQVLALKLELGATRVELQKLRETYGPVLRILSSEDVELIRRIDDALSEDRKESTMRVSTAAVLAAKVHDVPIETVLGVMSVESKFRADAVSPTKARGLMQLTGLIWRHYSQSFPEDKDVHDELMNTFVGVHFLADLRRQYKTEESALLHYWGGPAAVEEGGSYAGLVLNQAKKWRDVLGQGS